MAHPVDDTLGSQDCTHPEGCINSLLKCPFNCGQSVLKRNLVAHLSTSCKNNQEVLCHGCIQSELRQRNLPHLLVNSISNYLKSQAEKDSTFSLELYSYGSVPCSMKDLGCRFVGEASVRLQHEKDLGLHLRLLAMTLRQEFQDNKGVPCNQNSTESSSHAEKMESLEQRLTDLFQDFDALKSQVSAMETLLVKISQSQEAHAKCLGQILGQLEKKQQINFKKNISPPSLKIPEQLPQVFSLGLQQTLSGFTVFQLQNRIAEILYDTTNNQNIENIYLGAFGKVGSLNTSLSTTINSKWYRISYCITLTPAWNLSFDFAFHDKDQHFQKRYKYAVLVVDLRNKMLFCSTAAFDQNCHFDVANMDPTSEPVPWLFLCHG